MAAVVAVACSPSTIRWHSGGRRFRPAVARACGADGMVRRGPPADAGARQHPTGRGRRRAAGGGGRRRRGAPAQRRGSGAAPAGGDGVGRRVFPPGDPLAESDVGRAFVWVGRAWAGALAAVGVVGATVHEGASRPPTAWSAAVCFAGLGPGEVTVDGAKVVGISQRRRRDGALFQCGALVRWYTGAPARPAHARRRSPELGRGGAGRDRGGDGRRPGPAGTCLRGGVERGLRGNTDRRGAVARRPTDQAGRGGHVTPWMATGGCAPPRDAGLLFLFRGGAAVSLGSGFGL